MTVQAYDLGTPSLNSSVDVIIASRYAEQLFLVFFVILKFRKKTVTYNLGPYQTFSHYFPSAWHALLYQYGCKNSHRQNKSLISSCSCSCSSSSSRLLPPPASSCYSPTLSSLSLRPSLIPASLPPFVTFSASLDSFLTPPHPTFSLLLIAFHRQLRSQYEIMVQIFRIFNHEFVTM